MITSNGGIIATSISKSCTHCLLGDKGTTDYGLLTGEGSMKHKEALKAKLKIMTQEEAYQLIGDKNKDEKVKAEISSSTTNMILNSHSGSSVTKTTAMAWLNNVPDMNKGLEEFDAIRLKNKKD